MSGFVGLRDHINGQDHRVVWLLGALKLRQWTMQEWIISEDMSGVDFEEVE